MSKANERYQERLAELRAELMKFTTNLENHVEKQKTTVSNQNNYGYAGDLGHCLETIKDLNRFLTSSED